MTLPTAVPPDQTIETPVHSRSVHRDALAGLNFEAYEPGVACATLAADDTGVSGRYFEVVA